MQPGRPAFERQPRSKWRLFPGGVVGLGRAALLLGGKQNRASGQERGFFAVGGVDGQVGGAAQHYEKALAVIGRSDAVFHDLRHFAGTMTARVGNLPETMARLGHSTVNASLRYQQRMSGRDAEIAAALSALAENASADT